jgi:pimeloyl-ACP methyl ester carboxylesterase
MCISRNSGYEARGRRKIVRAGFTEKLSALPDGSILCYGEGPPSGPPLLLIHGQMVSWVDYANALPGLPKRCHVYCVDCHGHGGSTKDAAKHKAREMGAGFAWFIENVIGAPATLSGHSSGGLLAVWIAANRLDLVDCALIEDAPFFSTGEGRREKTFYWLDGFASIHACLAQLARMASTASTASVDHASVKGYTLFCLERSCLSSFFGGKGWEKIVLAPEWKRLAKSAGNNRQGACKPPHA